MVRVKGILEMCVFHLFLFKPTPKEDPWAADQRKTRKSVIPRAEELLPPESGTPELVVGFGGLGI